jgi:hypothetical protein
MEVIVDYGKLYDVGNDIKNQNELLLDEFNKLLSIIENMQINWDGTDYNNFKTTAVEYIEEQKELVNQIEFMGKFMIYSSGTYERMNEEWGEKMKRMGEDCNGDEKYTS